MYRSGMSSFFVYRREIVARRGKSETGERFDTGDRGGWKNRTAIRQIVARGELPVKNHRNVSMQSELVTKVFL